VLGVPMSGSVVGLVGLSLLYLVLALALGLFISTMADSQVTAMLISGMLLILPLIVLSGMVFPIENMPGVLQGISCIVPARWYIEAVRKLMVEGLPFAAVLKEFAVLAVMTGALIGVVLESSTINSNNDANTTRFTRQGVPAVLPQSVPAENGGRLSDDGDARAFRGSRRWMSVMSASRWSTTTARPLRGGSSGRSEPRTISGSTVSRNITALRWQRWIGAMST